MHDLNQLPETETVRRQSRLLFLAAIGITVASGIWVGSTHFSNQQIKTDLQQTLASTEAEIKAVPPLSSIEPASREMRSLRWRSTTRLLKCSGVIASESCRSKAPRWESM